MSILGWFRDLISRSEVIEPPHVSDSRIENLKQLFEKIDPTRCDFEFKNIKYVILYVRLPKINHYTLLLRSINSKLRTNTPLDNSFESKNFMHVRMNEFFIGEDDLYMDPVEQLELLRNEVLKFCDMGILLEQSVDGQDQYNFFMLFAVVENLFDLGNAFSERTIH